MFSNQTFVYNCCFIGQGNVPQCVIYVVVHVNVMNYAKIWIQEKCIVIDVYWNLVTLAKDEYAPCVLHNVTDIVMDVSAFSVPHNFTVPIYEFISH